MALSAIWLFLRRQRWIVLGGLILLLLALGRDLLHRPVAQRMTCANLLQACSITVGQKQYTLQSLQPISTSGFFTLQLGGQASEVQGSWHMLAMEMGPNQYRFVPTDNGRWQAKMALPLCTQARHDWLLQLTIDGETVEVITSSSAH